MGTLAGFAPSVLVLAPPAAFGEAEPSAEEPLQARDEAVVAARPARTGPRTEYRDLLLVFGPQERLSIAQVAHRAGSPLIPAATPGTGDDPRHSRTRPPADSPFG